MPKRLLIVLLMIVALAALGLHIQIQRRGTARVIRKGDRVRVIQGRFGLAPRYGVRPCSVTAQDGRLRFREDATITDALERQYPVQIRFDYESPSTIPADWPEGDWCNALHSQVWGALNRWATTSNPDSLASDPRGAGRAGSKFLENRLQYLRPRNLTVRLQVPASLAGTTVVAEVAEKSVPEQPVIFLGLDGADWQLLDQYIASGLMPNLAALVKEGQSGYLTTEHPVLSPLLWTTMMTGVSPLQHRILDFTRFHPQSRTKEPITADERRVPAIWNMATYGGKSVAVFGIWATYPAEPVRGVVVSDRLFTFLHDETTPPPGVVFPPGRESWARQILSDAKKSVTFENLRDYLPWLTETEFQSHTWKDPYSHPVTALHRILVESEIYHRLSTNYLRERTPDLTVIYFQGTDSIGHVFAPFNPPRQAEVSEEDFARYKDVAAKYFQYVDRQLGDYRELARAKKAVLVLGSDHGFKWNEGRPTRLSSFAAPTAAKWHSKDGIYLIWGHGGSSGNRERGGISQICSTLLELAGLPHGKNLSGPPLQITRSGAATVDYSRHYRPVAPPAAPSSEAASEEIAKLRALGYVGAGESTTAPADASTRTAGSYNTEGLILKNLGREREAVAAFEKAMSLDPNLPAPAWNLSDFLFEKMRDLDRSDDLLVRAFANDLPEGTELLIGRAIGYQRSRLPERSLRLLEAAVNVKPSNADLVMFRGRYRIDRGDCRNALEDFRKAQQLAPRNPIAYASAGIAEECLGNRASAELYFRRSLEIDPNQPKVRAFLRAIR